MKKLKKWSLLKKWGLVLLRLSFDILTSNKVLPPLIIGGGFLFLVLINTWCLAENLPLRETRTEFALGNHDGTVLSSSGIILSPNLVKNSGFENGFTNWKQNSAILDGGYNGSYSAKLIATGTGNYKGGAECDKIPIENSSSAKYTVTAWLKCSVTTGNYFFRVIYYDAGGNEISHKELKTYTGSSSGWEYLTTTVGGSGSGAAFTFPSGCTQISLDHCWYNSSNPPSGEGWMDDVLFIGGTFTDSGTFTSRIIDLGEKTSLGRIYWTADLSETCSISFNVASASSTTALNTPTWSPTIYTSGTEIDTGAGRYIRYRANLHGSSLVSPILKEVRITSAAKGLNPSPSYAVKEGENLSFDIYFEVPMDQNQKCTVTIYPEVGNSFSIPASSGNFSSSTLFRTGTVSVPSVGNGFATVRVTGGRTAKNWDLFYANSSILIIDNLGYVSKTKSEFFPDPFSPNGDGKCDSTKLIFSLDSEQLVSVRIYNYKGALVKTLVESETYYGSVQIPWDGTDENNKVLPVGIYLYQLKIGNTIKTGTVTLVK